MDMVMLHPAEERINILAPVVRGRKGEFKRELAALAARGDAVEDGRWSRVLTAAVDGADGLVAVEPGDDGRVAVTVAAGGGGVAGYQRSYVDGLRGVAGWGARLYESGATAGHLVYTSSTSVYPQDGGVRVTEADSTGGEAETTRALIEAERIALAWPGAGATVLRLAGIYGPGRVHLVGQVRSGEVAGVAETRLNLVHRDDIVDAMEAVWARGAAGAEVFNLADDGAATKGEVVAWLAERLGVAMPRFTGRPAGGRRAVTPDRVIDAGRARAVLGWRPAHPTFREGYAEVLAGEIQA